MRTWEILCIVSSALVAGLFSGPWTALSRSFRTYHSMLFHGIVAHMCEGMTPAITVLMPISVLSMIPLLIGSYANHSVSFAFDAAALVLNLASIFIAVGFELRIVNGIAAWSATAIPKDWEASRERWLTVHRLRVFTGLASLLSLIVATLVA